MGRTATTLPHDKELDLSSQALVEEWLGQHRWLFLGPYSHLRAELRAVTMEHGLVIDLILRDGEAADIQCVCSNVIDHVVLRQAENLFSLFEAVVQGLQLSVERELGRTERLPWDAALVRSEAPPIQPEGDPLKVALEQLWGEG